MGLAKPSETRRLTGTGRVLARQQSAGRLFGLIWLRTDQFLRPKPAPLAGYPDPLLTLHMGSSGFVIVVDEELLGLRCTSRLGFGFSEVMFFAALFR